MTNESLRLGNVSLTSLKLRSIILSLFVLLGIGNVWGATATFTPSSRSAGTLSGAPTGATATYYNSYNNATQITNGNTATLTLSGFDGCTITGITINMRRSNSASANINVTVNDNTKLVNNHTQTLTSTAGDKVMTLANTTTVVGTDKTIVITVYANASSAYAFYYNISYTAASPKTVLFNTGAGNPSVSSRTEASGGAGITLPSTSDLTPACSGDGWVLYGWATAAYGSSSTTTAPSATLAGLAGATYKPATNNVTLYAVYRKINGSPSNTSITYTINGNWTTNNGNWTIISGALSNLATGKWGINSGSTSATSPASYPDISEVKFTGTKSGSGEGSVEFLYGSGSSWTSLGSKSMANTLTWSIDPVVSGNLKIVFTRTNGNIYIASIKVTYSNTSYFYWSAPTCCTPLGSINGSFF